MFKFQYFTFFLNPVRMESLFPEKHSKIDILTKALLRKEGIGYDHRGSKLAYVSVDRYGDFILGKIGRRSALRRNLPPANNFQETTEETWPFCYVLFNLNQDPRTGQKIAFEYKSSVFTNPFEQLKAFSEALNQLLVSSGYFIAINPVTQEQKFWSLIDEYQGRIEKLSFAFNAPNLFGLNNSLNQDLLDAQQRYGLNKATFELENSDGKLNVPKDDPFIKEGAEYITRGGGQYSIKIKGSVRRVIKSKNNIETKVLNITNLEVEAKNPGIIKNVFDEIFGSK